MNTNPQESSKRLGYLDGLRGLACMQVVFLHVFSAYFPGLVENHTQVKTLAYLIRHSKLFFLYDGPSAVFIFFCLSGYVLTRAFKDSKYGMLALIQARITRLWIPTSIFGMLALFLYVLFGTSHAILGHIVNSDWLSAVWDVKLSFEIILKDIFAVPIFVGYQGSPLSLLFPDLFVNDPHSPNALNSPVWTMSVELQGSLLILALLYLWQRARILWATVMILSLLYFPEQFGCFLVGHIAAILMLAERPVIEGRAFSYVMLLIVGGGIYLATHNAGRPLFVGVSILFVGVLQCELCRKFLGHPILTKLGHLSFTIYLIHWGFVLGVGSWIILKLIPLIGLSISRCLVAPLVICLVLWVAARLVIVDEIATQFSHRVKKGDFLCAKTGNGNLEHSRNHETS